MSRLWDRGEVLDAAVLRLTVDRDPELDLALVPWDCLASAAHARMLERIGILTGDELVGLERELAAIRAEAVAGGFTISLEQEDGHTAIENRLTATLGDAGRKIHTARSRNDQVIAALRLWGRDRALAQLDGLLAVAEALLELAGEHRETSFPGTTHTRQAMPSTLGHHFGAWAEGLLDDAPWLRRSFDHLNRSPLGSGSGFGAAVALDRGLVSKLLAFERPQANTLAVQNDRGKSEFLALGSAAAAATDLGRLAADLIRFSSEELGYVALPDAVTTGSSIMPQKRNPDVLELIRAGAGRLRSRQAEVGSVFGGLTAGYHRDLQLTKEPFLAGMQSLVDMLTAIGPVLTGLEVDRERCRAAVLPSTGATDAAMARVRAGMPFRDAYKEAARSPEALGGEAAEAWRERTHLGAPGDFSQQAARAALASERAWLAATRERVELDLL